VSTLQTIKVTVNGTEYERAVEPRLLLSDFLRHDLGLSGTHVGCEHGICVAVQANGHEVRTVESLGTPEKMHPLQEAFSEKHALQCGFCTPGFLMSLVPFLEKNPDPSEEEIREAIDGNLCRCTGYQNMLGAVKLAAKKMAASQEEKGR